MKWRALLALAAALAGCAMQPQVPPGPGAAALGKVAVVAGGGTPEIGFAGFAHGRAEGAAIGAGSTFLACAASMGPGACAGPYCGAVVVLWLGICGVASAVGAAVGAGSAMDARTAAATEARMRAALDANAIQESLRLQIEAAARAQGAQPAARAEADTLLEAALVKAGTEGAGINAPVGLVMEARVRLLRAADGAELYSARIVHLGPRLKLEDWAGGGGDRLLRALDAGYEALGAHIADGVYLLYPFPSQEAGWAGTLSASFGLAPIDPPTRGTDTGAALTERFEWAGVRSLQPTLGWQAFPREADLAAAPAEMRRVQNVTYDLVIARERNRAPAETVYRRSGLPRPEHRLQAPLEPDARYFWTVRARFELDGRPRVTGWGSTHYQARDSMTAPSSFSYRFRTP
ncbi:MAG TPA: hypothetical protein VFP62_02390 [Burkholderiales bacterium]|jgi:hypothetical protein|nr:hypothetical protein [Burkholderiales bacterium]